MLRATVVYVYMWKAALGISQGMKALCLLILAKRNVSALITELAWEISKLHYT